MAHSSIQRDARSLAASLLPHLKDACQGHLKKVIWFKADWQRGGAATGRGRWVPKTGDPMDVIIKIPVRPRELTWLHRLQQTEPDSPEPVVPRLLGSGTTVYAASSTGADYVSERCARTIDRGSMRRRSAGAHS